MKKMIIFIMVFFIVFSFSGLIFADDNSFAKPSVGDVLGDVLCIRPVGFIEIAINSLFFVFSLPVTILLQETKDAEEYLIKDPYNFYFNRGLGEPLGGK
jgi:uncharacterized membrane protein